MAAKRMPRETLCECCGAVVPLDVLGWLWYEENDWERSVAGQARQCESCGADVYAFVGDLSLCESAAAYFSGVTH